MLRIELRQFEFRLETNEQRTELSIWPKNDMAERASEFLGIDDAIELRVMLGGFIEARKREIEAETIANN